MHEIGKWGKGLSDRQGKKEEGGSAKCRLSNWEFGGPGGRACSLITCGKGNVFFFSPQEHHMAIKFKIDEVTMCTCRDYFKMHYRRLRRLMH